MTIAPQTAPQIGPAPRWLLLLPLLVLLAWFPIAPFWASDDFFALVWCKDLRNVLADFHGPWYGAHDLFFFYRPLISLSLWLELQVAGSAPFLAHFDNALVHAISALLVALLWRRFLSPGYAFLAGAVYGLSPIHIGAVAWAVARTDVFSCALALGSALAFLRWQEGRRHALGWSLGLFAAALLCKETVLSLPGLLFLLALARQDSGGVWPRLRAAALSVLPHALLLLAYLGWRLFILGRMGGYDAASYDVMAMARGLLDYALGLCNPFHWSPPIAGFDAPSWLQPVGLHIAGFLPLLGGALFLLRRRAFLGLAAALAWFLLASVPMASFFAQSDNHHNLRYFCLAFAGLAGLLTLGGRALAALALGSAAVVLVQVRTEQWRADTQSAAMHREMARQQVELGGGRWFVAGLPHQSPNGVALQYHFGIDRILDPLFAHGDCRLFAHRPIFDLPGTSKLVDEDDAPIAVPDGTTLWFRGSELLTTTPQKPIAELPIDGPDRIDCTTPALYRLNSGEQPVALRMPGVRTEALRVSFFTASGYLSAVVPNHAAPGAADGMLDLLRFYQQAEWAPGRPLIQGLGPSTIMDLDTVFPVLLEGGRVQGGAFAPTHRARRLLHVQFDRDLPRLLRGG